MVVINNGMSSSGSGSECYDGDGIWRVEQVETIALLRMPLFLLLLSLCSS